MGFLNSGHITDVSLAVPVFVTRPTIAEQDHTLQLLNSAGVFLVPVEDSEEDS